MEISASAANTALAIRPMTAADIDAVLAIETEVCLFPWTAGIFRDCLRVGYRCRLLVAPRVLGYGVLSVAAQEAHLLNLSIHPDYHRRGLAWHLLGRLLAEVAEVAEVIFLEVRVSNAAAQGLYAKAGFAEVGVRKGYYPAVGGREDAVVMARSLTSNPFATTIR
ncbi:MAG: ribosomal protein S18-alanine N-acetyltransferase [Candidatus Competibacterales bacterium]